MPETAERTAARGLQDGIEGSRFGRAVISVFVVVTVASLVVWNLPDSELRRRALPPVEPYVNLTGLDQNWGVFAPDPRRETIAVFARAKYRSGREETLQFPSGDPVIGAYWDYRWRKFYEAASSPAHEGLWHAAAAWFARTAAEKGGTVSSVTLVRRASTLLPPGPAPEHAEPREEEYYTLTVEAPRDGS